MPLWGKRAASLSISACHIFGEKQNGDDYRLALVSLDDHYCAWGCIETNETRVTSMNANLFLKVAAVLSIAVVTGCAEGTSVVTGERRPAISPDQVQLFTSPPQRPHEVIALVRAESSSGWTDQQSVDYAVQELKNQAAAVGANGVILGQQGTQLGGFVMSDNVAIPYDEQTVQGTAIYISSQ